jgi:hypothetical protein
MVLTDENFNMAILILYLLSRADIAQRDPKNP